VVGKTNKKTKLKAAGTHRSANTNTGSVSATRYLETESLKHCFLIFDPKINGFPGLIVEHLCVKFVDLSWIYF